MAYKNKNTDSTVKLLVVEDNPIVQMAIQTMLGQLGHQADIAGDGKTALALYNADYHLILMDIELPDIDGTTVTQTIRKIERKKSVPIVAMTSHHDEPEWKKKCLDVGMNDVLGKPDQDQLKLLIKKYVEA